MIHLASVNCGLPEAPKPLVVAGVAVNLSLATLSCFFFRPSSSAGRAVCVHSVDADAHRGLRPFVCKPTKSLDSAPKSLQAEIAQHFPGTLLLSSQHPPRSRFEHSLH